MKNIPGGTFTMGSDSSADWTSARPKHQVTLSAFKLQETAVTQEQYLAVMRTNPSWYKTETDASLRPVESVSWYNAARFCNALSALSGLTLVYDTTTWAADTSKKGYRLPTESQWEYACRAGSTTTYWWGADTTGIGARAWYGNNNDGTPQPVAKKIANAYGLYDMAGNVWQWVNDWYGSYTSTPQTNPMGPSSGSQNVLRGGGITMRWRHSCVRPVATTTTRTLPPPTLAFGLLSPPNRLSLRSAAQTNCLNTIHKITGFARLKIKKNRTGYYSMLYK